MNMMSQWAKVLCRKGFGIYADGLFFLDRPPENSNLAYIWHFFNQDGSVGDMCGNASRCAAWFAHAMGIAPAEHRFGTLAGTIRARIIETGPHGGQVRVQLPQPGDIELNISLGLNGESICVHHIVIGVPHAVVFVDDVTTIDVCRIGSMIRHHAYFAPKGVNVNFAQIMDPHTLRIRTYERGVEAETFACGTGAASTHFISHGLGYTDGCARIETVKGLELIIDIEDKNVFLQGGAELVFKGEFSPLNFGLQPFFPAG